MLEEQIADIHEQDFADAKDLLGEASQALERQFRPLNVLLDKLESDQLSALAKTVAGNGAVMGLKPPLNREQRNRQISRILRDDYSALNLITISNTLLHTTALALGRGDIAAIALEHLGNLAPLVIKIGELLPVVTARELRAEFPKVDLSVAQTALKNTQLAWRKAS